MPEGFGTALKPSLEPVTLARKPLCGTVAATVLEHGTGALNVEACRVGSEGGTTKGSRPIGNGKGIYGAGLHGACDIVSLDAGRWPANLIHDGSGEVLALFPESKDGVAGKRSGVAHVTLHGLGARDEPWGGYGGGGSAARFFYCAKASRSERGEGNSHPTVKPIALMRYLCRLVTPPGGLVLDPFAGSGTTGIAALAEGFRFLGIEREPQYVEIAKRRCAHAAETRQPELFDGVVA